MAALFWIAGVKIITCMFEYLKWGYIIIRTLRIFGG